MRRKIHEKFIIKPTTKDFLTSLTSYHTGCKILLENSDREYSSFLNNLLENSFYYEENKLWSIKSLVDNTGVKRERVTKWISSIYNDIFDLNDVNPTLFKQDGAPHLLSFKNFDMYASFTIWLSRTPGLNEHLTWRFVNAAVATSRFWVRDVNYFLDEPDPVIHVSLDGGIQNRYENFITDRAKFEGVLGIMDDFNLSRGEIDKILLDYYRHR